MSKDLENVEGEHLGKSIVGKGRSHFKTCMFKVHLGGQVFETKQVCREGSKKWNKIKQSEGTSELLGENICNIYSKKSIDSCKKSSNT